MPLRDSDGNIIGTFGISKDITHLKRLEQEANEKNEELKSQEEELRQNLEEMHTTQEDMRRQIEENVKMQEALGKEKALLDALLNNVPEHIYFKDKESRFLRFSKSMVKLFGLKKAEELVGKSDFDFFSDEHSRPAYEGEQEIIRTGKAIIDLEEKNVMADGRTSWVNTTKMPLRDSDGNIIGTFGISKDITHLKRLEQETNEKNEELKSQDEELRQNIEELQATYEQMERLKLEENERNEKMIKDMEDYRKFLINVLDQIPGKIFVKDHDGKLLLLNSEVAKVYNKSVEELIGTSDFDNHTLKDAKVYRAKELEIIANGAETYIQEESLTGSKRFLKTTKMPFHLPHLNKTGLIGFQIDVTDAILLEDKIKKLNAEIKALRGKVTGK
jgi:PAS domain S-box-containing protein